MGGSTCATSAISSRPSPTRCFGRGPRSGIGGCRPPAHQARLEVLTEALVHLARKGLTAASVIANFYRQRVIPLTERSLSIFGLTPGVPASGSRTSMVLLPRGIAAQRARNAVAEFPNDKNDLWEIKMRPEPGYISVVSLDFILLSTCVIPFPFLLPDSDLTAFCREWAASATPRGLRSRRNARSTAFTQKR